MSNDPIILAAQARLREILAERDELEAFIETHRRLSKRLMKPDDETATAPVLPVAKPAQVTRAARPNSTIEILNAVGKVLNRHGKPMMLSDLHDALDVEGIVIPGKDPRNNLSAKLYASKTFKTQRGVGWWFARDLSKDKGLADESEASNSSGVSAPENGG